MKYQDDLVWPETKTEALVHQKRAAETIKLLGHFDDLKLVAAVDTAYGKNAEIVFASAVVVSFPEIEEIDRSFQYDPVKFPYVPGLFFYREGETILKALGKLQCDPDIIIVQGHGIAHPRRCGIASQVGLALNKPTIGCARKLLTGFHRPVPPGKSQYQPIIADGKEIGCAYRSKDGVKPIFISPGHMCSSEQARDIVVRNLRGFRLPEPLRLAHLFANKFRRRIETKSDTRKDAKSQTVKSGREE